VIWSRGFRSQQGHVSDHVGFVGVPYLRQVPEPNTLNFFFSLSPHPDPVPKNFSCEQNVFCWL
jgi:hypothetical protein